MFEKLVRKVAAGAIGIAVVGVIIVLLGEGMKAKS